MLAILIATLTLYSPFIFFDKSIQWDSADYFLPMRYLLSEAFRLNELPLWNPYTRLGLPLHADPQSGAAYIPSLIIAYLFGYSFKILAFEFVAHILIAGTGFYFLTYKLIQRQSISIFISICYLSSGFFISNSQHLSWIIAAAYLPWVILFYIRIIDKQSILNILSLSLVIYLMLCGGYPAFCIITAYGVIIHLVYFSINCLIKNATKKLISIVTSLTLSILISILMSAYMLYSFIETYSSITRDIQLSKMFQEGAFTILCFISFLFPGAVVSSINNLNTDLSMANAYIGLIPIIVLPLILITRNKKSIYFLLIAFLFLLIASGDATPLRSILFNYVPFLNTFRFPSLFRLFAIVSLLISVAYLINDMFYNYVKIFKYYLIAITLLSFLISIGILVNNLSIPIPNLFKPSSWRNYFENTNASYVIQWQIVLQTIFLILSLLGLVVSRNKSTIQLICFLLIQIISLVMFESFNARVTLCANKSASHVDSIIKAEKIFKSNSDYLLNTVTHVGDNKYEPQYQNVNIYQNKISADGYNPFYFKSSDSLIENQKAYKEILNHKIIYSTDSSTSILSINHTNNSFSADITSKLNTNIILSQCYYKYWKAFIDNNQVEIHKKYSSIMSIEVPSGSHQIKFIYESQLLSSLYYLMWLVFITVIVAIIILTLRLLNKNKFPQTT